MPGACEAGIRRQIGEELLGEGDWWRVLAAWTIWVAQEGVLDPVTNLKLDLSGATFSMLAPTLAAKRRHDLPFCSEELRSRGHATLAADLNLFADHRHNNLVVQSWATNGFLGSRRVSAITAIMASNRGAAARHLRRLRQAGLLI